MNRKHTVLNLIWDWSRIADRAKRAKQSEKRQRVVRFGVCAVIYAALAAVCALGLLLFQYVGTVGIFTTILLCALALGIGGAGTLVCLITALVYWFCQLSVNRRLWTWLSLVLLLAILAFGAVIVFLLFP